MNVLDLKVPGVTSIVLGYCADSRAARAAPQEARKIFYDQLAEEFRSNKEITKAITLISQKVTLQDNSESYCLALSKKLRGFGERASIIPPIDENQVSHETNTNLDIHVILHSVEVFNTTLNSDTERMQKEMPHPEELHILHYNEKLTILPKEIGNFTNLLTLELCRNPFTYLPESIGNLTTLQRLSLNDNQLEELPDTIGNLVELVILSLSNNQLQELPQSMVNLTNLVELNLYKNKLTHRPEFLDSLPKLININLKENPCSANN